LATTIVSARIDMFNMMTSVHKVSASILGTVCGLLSVGTESKGLLSSESKLVIGKTSYLTERLYRGLKIKLTGRLVHINRISRGDAVFVT
jgi:hypothetical protein